MKTLPTEFTSDHFQFTQLKRQGMVALFRKGKPGQKCFVYEVVIIRSHNGFDVAGKHVEAGECMPSSCHWGEQGWTHLSCDYQGALARFEKLVIQQEAPALHTAIV